MEQFVVSARKYRPATFDTVVGQEVVTSTLKNAIRTGHLASAFLFTGPRGVGKTTCARILARTVNCESLGEDLVACGQCAPCKTFEEGHSLNIFELDAASNNSVDDIRNLILQVSIAPQVGTKKVYIIDEVHMLSSAAFNAFLKTLEEPPSYAIFILATTEKHKILPTILSRCQVFDFRRILPGDIVDHLAKIAGKEGIEADREALHEIARKADGALRDALSIFDQLVSFTGDRLTYQDVVRNLNVLDHEHYFRMTDNVVAGDVAAALVEYNSILQQGFDGHLFVTGLARHFRDLLMVQDPRTLPLLEVSSELAQRYGEQAARTPRDLLLKAMDRLAHCDYQYKQSKEPRLLVELTLMQLCQGVAPSERNSDQAAEKKKSDPGLASQKRVPEALPVVRSEPDTRPSAPPPDLVAAATPAPAVAKAPVDAGVPAVDAYVPRRRVVGQVSITAGTAELEAVPTQASPMPADEEGTMPGSTREVNHALLLRAWMDYARTQKERGRNSLHATLMAREPQVMGPGRISFSIVNEVQENYLRSEKPELLGFLRRQLGDDRLEMEVLKEEVQVKPRHTPLDRFRTMAERNPALLKLRETLDLDIH